MSNRTTEGVDNSLLLFKSSRIIFALSLQYDNRIAGVHLYGSPPCYPYSPL